jgi:hypothetical protein
MNSTANVKVETVPQEEDGQATGRAAASGVLQDRDAAGANGNSARPGNGSDRREQAGGSSNPAPDAFGEDEARLLLNELTGIESRCGDLAGRLMEIVRALQSGRVIGGGIGWELKGLQTDFEAFQRLTLELARSLSVPVEASAESSPTLADLRALLTLAADTQERSAFQRRNAHAGRVLEDVLTIEYAGAEGSNPLQECLSTAQRLRAEIAESHWPDVHPECAPLVEHRHAFSRLLDLVRRGDRLSDDEWGEAEEAVTASFGRRLAVAAVRGRLRVKSNAPPPAEPPKRCPTCNADLEPEAGFCDECGVKLK